MDHRAGSDVMPKCFFGESVLLFLGESLTREHRNLQCGLLEGPSRAGDLVGSIFRRLARLETGDNWKPAQISDLILWFNLIPVPRF